MLNLNKVTLACITCNRYKESNEAVLSSLNNISYTKTVILTDNVEAFSNITNSSIITIPPIKSKEEHSVFVMKDLNNYIDTDFVLIVQWDGFVLHPEMWTDEFLEYDYIGAPWWYTTIDKNDKYNVGNGGFSLRTKTLLDIVQNDIHIPACFPEDHHICRTFGEYLTDLGIKFAPESLASVFSFEVIPPKTKTFGFHDFKYYTKYIGAYKEKIMISTKLFTTFFKHLFPTDVVLEIGGGVFMPLLQKHVREYTCFSPTGSEEELVALLKEKEFNKILFSDNDSFTKINCVLNNVQNANTLFFLHAPNTSTVIDYLFEFNVIDSSAEMVVAKAILGDRR